MAMPTRIAKRVLVACLALNATIVLVSWVIWGGKIAALIGLVLTAAALIGFAQGEAER